MSQKSSLPQATQSVSRLLTADMQEPPNFTWVAAISVHATQAEAARAFLDFLATQPARELVKAKGMEPGE